MKNRPFSAAFAGQDLILGMELSVSAQRAQSDDFYVSSMVRKVSDVSG